MSKIMFLSRTSLVQSFLTVFGRLDDTFSLPRFPLRNCICLKVWYRIVGCLGSHLKIIKESIEENFYFDKGVLACSMSTIFTHLFSLEISGLP